MTDEWQVRNLHKHSFSFTSSWVNGDLTRSKSRIDRILVHSSLTDRLANMEIIQSGLMSDHDVVAAHILSQGDPERGPPRFRMKASDLLDPRLREACCIIL